MDIATDIAEDASGLIFDAIAADPQVRSLLRQLEVREGGVLRAGYVIEIAAFNLAGDRVTFGGEFDFHGGRQPVHRGEPALRANVSGVLTRRGRDQWPVVELTVLGVQQVDATDAPDAVPVHGAVGPASGFLDRIAMKIANAAVGQATRRPYAGPERRLVPRN